MFNKIDGISFVFAVIFAGFFAVLVVLAGHTFDESFDNKDRMYCNSAKVSGNEEYLVKCECFYNGNDIRCIYEGK